MKERIWTCKIGGVADFKRDCADFKRDCAVGADFPMRRAVEKAFYELTGEYPEYIFSGWSAELTEGERAVVENRQPNREKIVADLRVQLNELGES